MLPPIGKRRPYPPLALTVIRATERGTPAGRERIDWKLLTDLPVQSRRELVEKLDWYAMRWKIETFHKILKSGCRAEAAKLRSRAPDRPIRTQKDVLEFSEMLLNGLVRGRIDPHIASSAAALLKQHCLVIGLRSGTGFRPWVTMWVRLD
ncbi:MAG TPA: hypothetical protein VNF74_05395 [Terriglobales bacterium]|nr:hypothetical protein [Terriglobales bacterium]